MADSTLNILIKLRNQAQAGITKLKKNLKESALAAEELGDADIDELTDDVEDLNEELEETKKKADEAAEGFDNIADAGKKITAIGVAIATPFLLAAKAAGEFQTQIAEIETLVPATTTANEELRDSVISLSNEFGVDRSKVAAALYQTISTGAEVGADANERLAVALTLARAGVADVETATFGLATVLNAFNLEGTDAARVADSLFTTVKGGATTIDQLSSFLFQAAPLASALSVEFTELNAAIQTITLSGTPTAQATTQIRAALQGLARDTPEVNEALGEFASVSEAIAKIGLQATFDRIRKASKGSEAQLIKLIGSIEGVQAILQLTGKASGRFTQALTAQEEASGAAARAAALIEQSFGVQLEQAIVRVSNAFTQLGEAVIPVLEPLVAQVSALAIAFQQLLANDDLAIFIAQLTLKFGAFVTIIGTATLAFGLLGKLFLASKTRILAIGKALGATRVALTATTFSVKALGVAMRGLLGPIGLVITAFLFFRDSADEMEESLAEATQTVDEAIRAFNSLSEIDRIKALELAKTQVSQLRIQVKLAIADLKRLRDEQAGGAGVVAQVLTTEGDISEQVGKVADLNEQLELAQRNFEILGEKSEISIANIDISEEGLANLDGQFLTAGLAAAELRAEIGRLERSLDAFDPETGQFSFDESAAGAAHAGAEGQVITNAQLQAQDSLRLLIAQARLATQEQALENIAAQLALVKEVKDAEALLAAQEAADADAKLSRAEQVAAARSGVQITSAQGRLDEAQARASADILRAENEQLTADLEEQLEKRIIDEKEFASERERILNSQLKSDADLAKLQLLNARNLTDAKIAVIKAGIDEEKLLADAQSQSETARSSAATLALVDAQIEVLELAFDATETTIQGRLAAIGIRTKAQIEAIARDLAEGSIEGIEKAFDRLITQLALKQVAINAQLAAGVLTQAEAQSRLRDEAEETAAVIEDFLIPAVEKLLETAPEDPALLQLLANLREELDKTQTSLSEFEQGLVVILESELANFFEDLLDGFDNLAESADKFIQGLRAAVLRLIAERLANQLIQSLFGSLVGSVGGSVPGGAQGGLVEAADGGFVKPVKFTKAAGGGVLKLAKGSGPGGRVRGPGTSTSDSIPALLSDGEYIMKAKSVKQYGLQMMEAINRGVAPRIDVERRLSITKPPRRRFQEGGQVGSPPSAAQLRAGASASGQQRSEQPTELVLNISDDALNSMMRDVLEREFGRILATR